MRIVEVRYPEDLLEALTASQQALNAILKEVEAEYWRFSPELREDLRAVYGYIDDAIEINFVEREI